MKYLSWWLILEASIILGSVSAAFIDRECGLRRLDGGQRRLAGVQRRLVGGQDAAVDSTPWMVFIHNRTHFLCGGSLIAKAFVLTAAHCVSPTPKILLARLGEYDWGPQKPCFGGLECIPSEQNYNVSDIYRHPLFKTRVRDDIAILKLDQEVSYTAQIRPICVLVRDFIEDWKRHVTTLKNLSLSGWGATKYSTASHVLKKANLTQIDITTCRNLYKYPVDQTHICAGDPQEYACKGDSGGPLGFMVSTNGTDYYIQVGIVSNGWFPCRGVSVFANVLSYSNWILEVIRKNKIIKKPQLVVQQNRGSTVPLVVNRSYQIMYF